MRPHVELIQQSDLRLHKAEFHRGEGTVYQRNLSYDEESGAASTRLHFETAWHRLGGFHEADTEWYILRGAVKLGDQMLGPHGYFRAPAGLRMPAISTRAGTEVLLFREYGDWGFSVSDQNRSDFVSRGGNTASDEPGELTVVDTSRLEWMPNVYEGDTQRFLKLKPLYEDPGLEGDNTKGFVTLLCWAPPGWSDNRMVHHPVFEEAYVIDGALDYNFGRLESGTYFFRPARVKHGHFVSGQEKGSTAIVRLDGTLINWITVNERFIAEGTPVNYDPETQAPLIAGIPVRSNSTGEWDLDGQ